MEASAGIEPAYTDLQSTSFLCDNRRLIPKKYQDKPETKTEPDTRRKASSLPNLMKPEHKCTTRMLGYCLNLGTTNAWSGFSLVAALRLSLSERASMAFSALNSLELTHAEMTAAASISSAGAPLPPFLGGMDDARFWASYASRSELKAYALACFEAMSAQDRMAFLRPIGEMEVAA